MWKFVAISLSVGAGTAYLIIKPNLPKKDKPLVLQKPDFQQNVVYMVQFPVSPHIRTISPFALKLETYLRLKKIPYDCIYTQRYKSVKGQIPYIELNGEQIPDSNQIIQELEKRGKVTKFSNWEFFLFHVKSE